MENVAPIEQQICINTKVKVNLKCRKYIHFKENLEEFDTILHLIAVKNFFSHRKKIFFTSRPKSSSQFGKKKKLAVEKDLKHSKKNMDIFNLEHICQFYITNLT